LVRIGANVGWALGPAAAGLLAAAAVGSSWGALSGTGIFRAMFVGSAALILTVLVAIALLVDETLERPKGPTGAGTPLSSSAAGGARRDLRAALTDGPFVALLVAGFFLYYVFTQDRQALPIYSRDFLGAPEGWIGLFLAANGLMVALLQLPVAYLLDRQSKVAALVCGAALFAASSATLLLTSSVWGVFLAFAGFFTLAEMILEVAGAALAAELAPEGRRATYLALFGCCFGAAYGLSPIASGLLLDARLPAYLWALQLVAAAAAAVALIRLSALKRRSSAKKPAG
jgi:MFS family permease